MRGLLLALLAALALFGTAAARAEERILRYASEVLVGQDGALEVTETIRVRSEGDEIKRGIYRDFPTRYRDRHGRSIRVDFDLLAVERDGRPEPYRMGSIDDGERVWIGEADVLLQPGEHEYMIRYRTTRQIGFFATFDELYWNVTGTGWSFPIDLAEIRIRLPQEAPFGRRAFYTGPEGSTASYAEVVSERPGEISFRTTAPLSPREGLTVAVAWPKNIVEAPQPRSPASLWLQDNLPPAIAGLGLFAIAAYYFHAWRKVGRGPAEGPTVPVFSPPDDLSPAAIRYVCEMGGYDDRTFAAALVDLGVHGRLRLVEGEKGWFTKPKTTIVKTGDAAGMAAAERQLIARLFEGQDEVLMDDDNHKIFSAAKSAHEKTLKAAYDGKMFIHNHLWSLAGIFFLFGAIWLTATSIILTDPELPNRRMGLVAAAMASFALGGAYGCFRLTRSARSIVRVLAWIGIALLLSAGLLLGIATFGVAVENERILPLLIPSLSIPLIMSAFWWMAAPTREGRKIMDRIAGFRQYLSITEGARLEAMHPPAMTPKLFERYLPHAIALEVENAWASRFTRVLAAAASTGQAQTMNWYSGHSDPWNDVDGFVDRVGSSLSSKVSSASTAPGSSSGSGGGGSSGGGGGGGGGGGW